MEPSDELAPPLITAIHGDAAAKVRRGVREGTCWYIPGRICHRFTGEKAKSFHLHAEPAAPLLAVEVTKLPT